MNIRRIYAQARILLKKLSNIVYDFFKNHKPKNITDIEQISDLISPLINAFEKTYKVSCKFSIENSFIRVLFHDKNHIPGVSEVIVGFVRYPKFGIQYNPRDGF